MKAAFLSCSLALLLNGHGCERTGEIQYSADLYCHHLVKSIETTIGLQNMVFPQASTPLKNETICYFNKKSCISCVLQIRDRVSLRNNENHIDFRFYNSLSDNLSDDIKVLVPEVISIEVDSIFDALPFPIIFETNSEGKITNCLPVSLDYISLDFKYLDNVFNAHAQTVAKPG